MIETTAGDVKFVDAPEVARTAERGVTLTIEATEVAGLPAPESGVGTYRANVRTSRVGRLFGRGWKRD